MPNNPNAPNRRDIFRFASAAGLSGMVGGSASATPQSAATPAETSAATPGETSAAEALQPLNRFPRMVQEYFVERVRAIEQAGIARRAQLKTKADAAAYVRDVRAKIQQCFGPWPEKTPLNPRISGVVERESYKIEKLIFESRPGFLVTANLYVPKGRNFPLPGVVGTCGHSANGKASEFYQSFAQGLARMGYVVLLYDPFGQGERLQYVDEKLEPRIGVGSLGRLEQRQPHDVELRQL